MYLQGEMVELGFGEAEAAGEQLWEATSPARRYHSDETKVSPSPTPTPSPDP